MAINIEARAGINKQLDVDGIVLKDKEPVSLVIMKFGGTSVGNPKAIEQTADIVEGYHRNGVPIVVIVSAMSGVTNELVKVYNAVEEGNFQKAVHIIGGLREKHIDTCKDLAMSSICRFDLEDELSGLFAELYREISLNDISGHEKVAKILSYGERLSTRILGRRLGLQAKIIDSSDIVYTDDNFLNATPNLPRTQTKAHEVIDPLLQRDFIPVVTGFIGTTIDGRITVLGRNSSDYSAAFIGGSLGAREVWFWKDVDGIYNEDRIIMSAVSCDEVKNIPGGTKVLHEKALEALKDFGLIGRVKNTFNPDALGTLIANLS